MNAAVNTAERSLHEKTNAFFDFFRSVDYYFQGRRTSIFIWGAFAVVFFAPLIDMLILPRRLSLTSVSTYLYLFFALISLIAWAGRFRDDDNQWSYRRLKEQLSLSFETLLYAYDEVKHKDKNSQLFTIGLWVFVAGFVFKAFQNISEVFRKPFQFLFGAKMGMLRSFESFTSFGYVLIFAGIGILLYLHFSKKMNVIEIFLGNAPKPHQIQLNLQNDYVVNISNTKQIHNIISANPDRTFRKTMGALLEWSPKSRQCEGDYEVDLARYLTKHLRKEKMPVSTQHAIRHGREIGRVDLLINSNLFIELKHKVKGSELDRASGQVLKYQRILQNNTTPLILLIVDAEYEKINQKLTEFIKDYNLKHIHKLIAVVVEPQRGRHVA